MPQLVPAALVAPTRSGLVAALNIGYRVRSLAGTYGTFVVAAASNSPIVEVGTGYYLATAGVSIADAGGVIEWWTNNSGSPGTFLSAVAVDPVPSNFTDLTITASTGRVTAASVQGNVTGSVASVTNPVTAETVTDKTGYSLSGTQTFNLTGNITGNLSGSVGSVTGSVGGSVGSVTGAVGSVTNPVTVGANNDKTNYSLTQEFPPNFSSLAITPTTGRVTVGTNADKTGYGLEDNAITAAKIATDAITSDKIAANAIGASEIAADAVTEIQAGLATQASLDTKASQSSVNAIPTTPAPTAAQNATQVRTELSTELGRIDATISSRLASSGYTTPPTTGQIRTELATELARIDVATSTRLAGAGYTAPPTAAQNAAATWTYATGDRALTGTQATEIAKIQGIRDKTDNLPTDPADQSLLIDAINTRLAASSYTAPPSSSDIAQAVETILLSTAPGDLLEAISNAVQGLFNAGTDVPVATLVSLIANQITTDHGAGSYVAPNISALALETSVQAVKTKTDAIPANPVLTTDARLGNLDATISSRASQVSVNAIPTTPAPTAAQNASQVRTELATELGRIDATISSRSTLTAGDIPAGLSAQQVWEYATRQLTGTQASNLAAIPNIPTNPLLASNYTPPPSAATIADAVWDETLSQHLTAGSTGAKLNLASTLTVGDIPAGLSAQQVWEYATRTLSVASGLTNAQEIKLNELHSKAGLNPAAPVTRTLNPSTGNVAETFTGVAINHVEAGTTVVTTRQP